jgi:2-keto-4-pentenoate hydratase/2-oxohepta-3-ene-1,7-dioic acid hydratase in catechol pathway
MRFLRVGDIGSETPVVRGANDQYFDLRSVASDIDPAFFASGGIERTERSLAAGSLEPIDIAGMRIGTPIARPSVVLCIGMNYAAHAAETGSAPPVSPVMFYKAPNTIVGPNDDIVLPPTSAKGDWEVELGVVIGARARYLASPEAALAHIAGYVLSNDVSERALQIETSGGQWSKGKSCESFNPLGPWLVTPEEIADVQSLQMASFVNGEARQDSSTKDMIFSVATLIHELSHVTVLEPGDLINTGTPEGVALSGRFPYLGEGDIVTMEISGLGRQRQLVTRARLTGTHVEP